MRAKQQAAKPPLARDFIKLMGDFYKIVRDFIKLMYKIDGGGNRRGAGGEAAAQASGGGAASVNVRTQEAIEVLAVCIHTMGRRSSQRRRRRRQFAH